MEKFVEYAPWIVVIYLFFRQNTLFVTPEQLSEKFVEFEKHLEEKFVQKEVYDVAIKEIKSDIEEIKTTLNKLYEKLINN